MKWFIDMKIALKLILGFLFVAVIAGIIGVSGILYLTEVQALDEQMFTRHTATFDDLTRVLQDYQKTRVNFRDMLILTDKTKVQQKIDGIKTLETEITASLKTFETEIKDSRVRDNFNTISKAMTDYFDYLDDEINFVKSNQQQKALDSMYSEGVQISDTVQTAGDNLMKLQVELAQQTARSNKATANSATIVMIVIAVAGVLIALLLGTYISRLLSKPIRKMADVAKMLSVGDIGVDKILDDRDLRLKLQKDEIGDLAGAFNALIAKTKDQVAEIQKLAEGDLTIDFKQSSENDLLGKGLVTLTDNLNQMIGTIMTASDQVTSGAGMVSNSSMALSQGATEQASSIEELTASLQEISAQVIHNAENARTASALATNAEQNAIEGNAQMRDMLTAMSEISESSGSINKIIKVIDDIAFQTNILALNAAVEAARAGQHGKGFAVVAEEVRSLAARSANAAKETTDMIESSIRKVEAGTKIANSTADALDQIVSEVKKASSLVGDISAASSEQSSSVEQINQGIVQISQVVQTNAATSEESAAASEELSSQAVQLKEIVGVFKLKGSTGTAGFSPVSKAAERRSVSSLPPARVKLSASDDGFGKY